MQLILNEESEAASTVVVPSSTPKKKVTGRKRTAEKEQKRTWERKRLIQDVVRCQKRKLKGGFLFWQPFW